jgi:hypothetical protein
MKWIFSAARHISRLLLFPWFLRHMRPVSGTCLLYLLALHQLGSGFQKAWGPHDQHFYQLAVLVHISKVRMGEQNCHMPWPARHLMNRFCRPLLPIKWS